MAGVIVRNKGVARRDIERLAKGLTDLLGDSVANQAQLLRAYDAESVRRLMDSLDNLANGVWVEKSVKSGVDTWVKRVYQREPSVAAIGIILNLLSPDTSKISASIGNLARAEKDDAFTGMLPAQRGFLEAQTTKVQIESTAMTRTIIEPGRVERVCRAAITACIQVLASMSREQMLEILMDETGARWSAFKEHHANKGLAALTQELNLEFDGDDDTIDVEPEVAASSEIQSQ